MVNVYITDIRQWNDEAVYRKWLKVLPEDRRLHVEEYKQMSDKRRSLAGSVLVREAFGKRYPGIDMHALSFKTEMNGKPYIEGYPQFHFNISHSGNYTVCAVSEENVGIDIQQTREVKVNVAKRFFTEKEKAQIEAVADTGELSKALLGKQQEMFFRIWSAKEAYVKLTGKGIKELQSFTADLQSGRILDTHRRQDISVYLKEYDVMQNYVLTVCAGEQNFGELQVFKIS